MKEVIFITPNMDGAIGSEAMGTLQLATILKKEGVDCEILQFFKIGDLKRFDTFLDNAMKMIEERQPKIVSFYTRCDVYHIDLKLAKMIKERWPEVYVVCGGPQSDITAEETIKQVPYIDFVCRGEGEKNIYTFFTSLLQKNPDLTIPGLAYRDGNEIKINPRAELIEDLDVLPMPDYSFFHFPSDEVKWRTRFPIEVGRGCPFSCTFCSTKTFWGRKFRLKSPERIYQEIKDAHEWYGVTKFKFTHDMFTLNRKKVIETCELLKTLDFPIDWGGSSRLDCIDRELIDVMADAGMKGIFLGIETGSPRMQKIINKNLKLDDAVGLVSYLNEKGIMVKASFMYGFPEETEEDLSQTIALIGKLLSLPNVKITTHLCAFYVGTELTSTYGKEMTPVDYYSNATGDYAVKECEDIIREYPDLFSHMLEYKTELRGKLKYFDLFFFVWSCMQPVYQYLSEKYPEGNLIQMYYDFVDANQEVLGVVEEFPENQWGRRFLKYDRFPSQFAEDENYDIIADLYRFHKIDNSKEVKEGGSVADVFCINPMDTNGKSIQECKRCIATVNWSNNQRTMTIYRL